MEGEKLNVPVGNRDDGARWWEETEHRSILCLPMLAQVEKTHYRRHHTGSCADR